MNTVCLFMEVEEATNKKCQNTHLESVKPGLTTRLREIQRTEKQVKQCCHRGTKSKIQTVGDSSQQNQFFPGRKEK